MLASLVSALISAQVGEMQLAVAGRLAQTQPQSESSVTQLLDAAQQNFNPLANVAAGIGANLDVSA
jgi:hypothetical protein